jgi:hypothetical protein
MLKVIVIFSLGVIATLVITSKMPSKSHSELDKNVSSFVDQSSTAALDATQKGLSKANEGVAEARKNAKK